MNTTLKYDNAVSAFLDEYWKHNFRPPTIREIMTGCAIHSSSHTHTIMRRLAKAGTIRLASNGSTRGAVPLWVIKAINSANVPKGLTA